MKDVYVLVSDEKVNGCIYNSKDEAETAINQICCSVDSWFKDYPVNVEDIKITTLYEYIKGIKEAEKVPELEKKIKELQEEVDTLNAATTDMARELQREREY